MGLREGSLFSRKDGERAAYSEIKQRIIDGRLPLGSRLVLRNLAQELGVSLIPVVEAVRMLERDGLVANVRSRGPGRGAQVRTWTRDEIVDLFKIRASLEALAADFCAERATDDEIAAVLTANEMFKDSTERHDSEMHIQADVEFHKAVVRGAHCPDLERITNNGSVIECSMRELGISLGVPRVLTEDRKRDHQEIADAIASRDAEIAEAAAKSHVEMSLERNLEWIGEIASAMSGYWNF